jgi:predicted TIM-barrel fold metal-dependent hydrolase
LGNIELDFKPTVKVWDSNVSLGPRHDFKVSVDTSEQTLEEMDRLEIEKAIVYSPHAVGFDSNDGNNYLIDLINSNERLIPQFVFNPTWDNLEQFQDEIEKNRISSVRMTPSVHQYPFENWIVKPWLSWLQETKIPLWIPISYEFLSNESPVNPSELHETIRQYPELQVVIADVHYKYSWIFQLLESLPNCYVEISQFIGTGAVEELIERLGYERILYGSGFPENNFGRQLYSIHQSGLEKNVLESICHKNVKELISNS